MKIIPTKGKVYLSVYIIKFVGVRLTDYKNISLYDFKELITLFTQLFFTSVVTKKIKNRKKCNVINFNCVQSMILNGNQISCLHTFFIK